MEPKRGQVFVWDGDTPILSKSIKAITNSPWSHAGWFIDEKTILEAEWNGVITSPASKYLDYPDRIQILDLPLASDVIEKCLDKAMSYLGKAGYDYMLIASLAWAYMTGKKCHSEIREWPGCFICSELVARPVWEVANFRFIPEKYNVELTVPGDIWKTLSAAQIGQQDAQQLIDDMNKGAQPS